MQVEVVSPERILYSGEATQVVTRTVGGGEIAFLAGHAPFLAALAENHTRIHLADGAIVNLAVHGGFVEVSNNKVSILSDVAELSDQIDVARARRALEEAEERHRREPTTESGAEVRRATARIAAAGGSPGGTAAH
jgi:F-type H+-transporting ATPase subunit epsilon